ncbi:MAG: zinc metallopeptidase [Verrucomicrobia bacterium]|nr:zinc metallopeptidase [Verrucomicrobiota bacterium]
MSLLAISLFVFTMALSLWATWRVKRTVMKYSEVPAASGHTGAQTAAAILAAAQIRDVEIVEEEGFLGDHYDPINKRLVLSSENYHGTSTAALGIAAHECGHALQHKVAYAPLEWRMAAVGATNYANMAVTFLPLLGMFTGFLSTYTGLLIMAIAWGVIMLFNLVTLPVEFDASNRAKLILGQMGFIRQGEEAVAVNKVLNAAALTYVAAFLTSLIYFLWYLIPLLTGGRSSND